MTYNVFLKHKTIQKARQWPKFMILFVMFNGRAGRALSGYKATQLHLVALYPDKTLLLVQVDNFSYWTDEQK